MSLARILNKSKGKQSYITDSRWVLPASFIGLEHEYEGVLESTLPNHSFANFWAYHEEQSLKDHGAEYVFTDPLFGIDATNALEWLVSYAKASKWKCTKRTGIHVHLDVRDLSVPQLAGLCILYGALERLLYRWIGDARDVSHFCIPLYRSDEALSEACGIIRSALNDEKDDGHTALLMADKFERYAGFNLQALAKFGSLEFRQLQTTHDLTRIVDWVNIIMSLKAASFKLPTSDGATVRMIQRMGSRELLTYVFSPRLAAQLYTAESDEDLALGMFSARDIAVHGCGYAGWTRKSFPKGENKGFAKWAKGAGEVKGKKEPQVFMDELPDMGEAERDILFETTIETAPPPMARAAAYEPAVARRDRALLWGENEGVFRDIVNEIAAPAPMPVARPVHDPDIRQQIQDLVNPAPRLRLPVTPPQPRPRNR